MKNKLYLLSLVVVAFLFLVGYIGWTTYAQRGNPARQTWEYKSIALVRGIGAREDRTTGMLRREEFSRWVEVSADGVKRFLSLLICRRRRTSWAIRAGNWFRQHLFRVSPD
jgi:hypothetical protein